MSCRRNNCKCHKRHKKTPSVSLFCDHAELSQRLLFPQVQPPPISVTRDQWNGIVIEGGTFAQMHYHLGYQAAVDRLWQTFFNVKALNGELASLVGAPGVANDRAIRAATYTDAEFVAQYATFSDISKTMIDNYLLGFNQRVSDVLANPALVPSEFTALGLAPQPITLAQLLRYLYNFARSFGGPIVEGNQQLTYLTQLGNLVATGKSFSDAEAIVSDIFSMRKKRSYGIIAEDADTLPKACPSTPGFSVPRVASRSVQLESRDIQEARDINQEPISVEEYLQQMKDLEEQREKMGVIRLGSSAFAISGNLTQSGRSLFNAGPQANLTTVPGVFLYTSLKNETLGFEFSGGGFPSLPINALGAFKNKKYIFEHGTQIGSLPGLPTLLQPTPASKIPPPVGPNPGPNTIFYLRTDVIVVKGGANVLQDVYVFIPVGETDPQGFVTNLALTAPAGSNFWTGTQALVVRNLDYMQDLIAFDTFILAHFSQSIDQLQNTIQGPGWSTLINQFWNGHDNRCNIFGCEPVGWYDFNTTKDIYPQGILGNPIPPKNSVVKRVSYFVKNPAKKYLANWNTALIQNLPCVYGDAEETRVEWIEKIVNEILAVRKISFSDLENIRVLQGNGVNGAARPFNAVNQIYNSDAFHNLFKARFFQAIDSVPPTANSVLAHTLLDNFEGGFIDGDNFALINSPDISEAWILAQRWGWEVQKAIIQATFGAAYAGFATSSNINSSNSNAYNRQVQALIARLLGTGLVPNPVFYPNWLSNTGTTYDNIIINALNTALTALGAQPWGVNGRPRVTYTNTGAPFVPTLAPWNGNNPLIANRASMYMYGQQGPKNSIDFSIVIQIGQSGFVKGPVGGPYVLFDTAQQDSYLRYEGISKPSLTVKKC